jgi:hypothetical protein
VLQDVQGHDGVDYPIETVVDVVSSTTLVNLRIYRAARAAAGKTNLWVSGMYWRRQVEKGLFDTIWWTNEPIET